MMHDFFDRHNIHLLIIDDDQRIRTLLKTYLGRNGFRVSAVASPAHARHLMQAIQFDLLVVDVMMPVEDGFSFTRTLRLEGSTPVILLTARGAAQDRIEGLKAGADDYLAKPFEPEELVLRIERILQRIEPAMQPVEIKFGDWVYHLARQELKKAGQLVRLTAAEQALLAQLARRAGSVVTRNMLITKLHYNSRRAIDVQMTRLRRKLETNPKEPVFLLTVYGEGYRLLADAH